MTYALSNIYFFQHILWAPIPLQGYQQKPYFPISVCALSYGNIFMGWFEEKFIFLLLTNLSDFYLRFIDGIFQIWNGTKTEFDHFFKKINECHPSIKFESEMSKTEINFLDTSV